VYGVDHDQNMIDQALSQELGGVTFLLIDGRIPLPDFPIDGAVSMNVFMEIRTVGAMTRACAARCARRGPAPALGLSPGGAVGAPAPCRHHLISRAHL
jgi:hypothetical protein